PGDRIAAGTGAHGGGPYRHTRNGPVQRRPLPPPGGAGQGSPDPPRHSAGQHPGDRPRQARAPGADARWDRRAAQPPGRDHGALNPGSPGSGTSPGPSHWTASSVTSSAASNGSRKVRTPGPRSATPPPPPPPPAPPPPLPPTPPP